MHFSYSELYRPPPAWASLPTPCQGLGSMSLLFESHFSGVWNLGEAGREGALKALYFSVLEWSTTYPGPQPNALDHSTPRSYSRVFIIPLLKPRKTASRKQITVGKQEYLSLTTMALSNQRGRADEPLITCAINDLCFQHSLAGRKWLEQSGTCYALFSTGLKLIWRPLTQLVKSFKICSTQRLFIAIKSSEKKIQ